MKSISIILFFICSIAATAQESGYTDSLLNYRLQYINSHELIKKTDKEFFRFFPINEKYKVHATFEKLTDTSGFIMKTSGSKSQKYFRYGKLQFNINDTLLQLTVYQSAQLMADTQYRNYLFVPFTDFTSGEQSYGGGKYLDFMIEDIRNGGLQVDFNKSYNPYCAYATGYNCPVPPRENDLPVGIFAGEMEYGKSH